MQRIKGLIGVDTYQNIEHVYTKEQVNKLLEEYQVNFPEAMHRNVKSMFKPDSNPDLVEKVTADMSAVLPRIALEIARAFMEPKLNLAQVLDKVKTPIHCIASDREIIDIEVTLRHVSSFEVSYMSDVGHFVMIEDPDTFNRLINEIFNEFVS
ncbi:MAG: alpha/beta hydrolase [Dehalococcoidales bacterium]|nr:MAG: alpha/beta hydrolase [Dehalococcoidales bacterium]